MLAGSDPSVPSFFWQPSPRGWRRCRLVSLALVLVACLHPVPPVPPAPSTGDSYLATTQPNAAPGDPTAASAISFDHRVLEAMSTYIEVSVPEGPGADAAVDEVFQIFKEVERDANEWKPGSPLAAVNAAAGGSAVKVPPDLFTLLQQGVALGRATGGAFDITWAALWGLWDFNAAHPRIPAAAELARQTALIDYRQLELDATAQTARLPRAGMKVGLGGIAKGYALQRSVEALRRRGIQQYLLSAGGQLAAGGTRGDRAWRAGIRDPRGTPDDLVAIVELHDASLSTSGDYERYFEQDGVRYHHILDPRTGLPARGLRSATVIAPNATDADALSTAVMVLGAEKGLELIASLPGTEALLVDDTGGVLVSPGLKPFMTSVPTAP